MIGYLQNNNMTMVNQIEDQTWLVKPWY